VTGDDRRVDGPVHRSRPGTLRDHFRPRAAVDGRSPGTPASGRRSWRVDDPPARGRTRDNGGDGRDSV